MSVLPNIKQHAATAAQELATRPWLAEFPGLSQLADFMSHSIADIETYPYIREFWFGVDLTLHGPTSDPTGVYKRTGEERENITELAGMIPIWDQKKQILARATIVDNYKKIQRAQKLCQAVSQQPAE